MSFRERLPIVIKHSQLHLFFLISFVYGIIFGGAFQIADLIRGDVLWDELMFGAFAAGGGYFCIFSLAMIGIYMGQSTKAFISLSMPRKLIVKLWKELTILISLIDSLVLMGLLFIAKAQGDTEFLRLLDMDLSVISPREFLTIFVFSMLSFMLLFQLISLIANIGNNHGLLNMFSSILLAIALIFLIVVPIINLIVWGEYLIFYMIAFIVLDLGLIHVNKRMLNRVEVLR